MNNYWLTLIIVLIIVLWIGISKRKEIPFQEIVPLDEHIAVINAGKWYYDKMSISLFEDDVKKVVAKYDKNGICMFESLNNDSTYTVKIKRKDIKGMLFYKTKNVSVKPIKGGSRYVVLVGASVGKSWNFQKLVKRVKLNERLVLGFRAIYNFDKSKAVEIMAANPEIFDCVILKECAAYFPRDIEQSKEDIIYWSEKLIKKGIQPILATVAPITSELDEKAPGKLASIIEYNDFIRQHAKQNDIKVLDIESMLRISNADRHLKKEYAQPDGYHLLEIAYSEALDKQSKLFLNNL